jgi:membrane protein DedA with SNARE-associated domain
VPRVTRLIHLVVHYGVPLVALNVFLEQIGAPVPAVPTLIVAGTLTRTGQMSSTYVILFAVLASLVADYIWFLLGRRYGYRILRTLCRISLSPDSCVRDTEANFERWGMKSLLIAKFIPGFSTVAPPLAGATKASTVQFLVYDGIGAFVWAGLAVAAGRTFHRAIATLLRALENLGWWAIVFAASALLLVIVAKWWQRRRFYKRLRVARVTAEELRAMLAGDEPPLVFDVRTQTAVQHDPRKIPTAVVAQMSELERHVGDIPPHREIVLYCT